jgi:hypothetical protein
MSSIPYSSIPSNVPLNPSKRLQIYDGPDVARGIYHDGTNASNKNPLVDVSGVGGVYEKDGKNEDIHVKLYQSPSFTPKGNKWVENTPIRSLVFSRPGMKRDFPLPEPHIFPRPILKRSDTNELFTPDRLNEKLHERALKVDRQDFFKVDQLSSVMKEFNLCGVMNTGPPLPTRLGTQRITEERVVDVKVSSVGEILNYWGEYVSGTDNPYLFFLLKEVNIEENTIYITGDDHGSVTHSNRWCGDLDLEDKFAHFSQAEKDNILRAYRVCKTVPRLVSKWSNQKYLTMEERKYTIRDQFNNTITKYGEVIYVGQCRVNPAYNPKARANHGCCELSLVDQRRANESSITAFVEARPTCIRRCTYDFHGYIDRVLK